MRLKQLTFMAIVSIALYGCTNVEPYERSYLAQENMKLDPNYLDEKFRRHLFFSREGTPGGYGADPTGCGCN